jgi:hypothetical protein
MIGKAGEWWGRRLQIPPLPFSLEIIDMDEC